MDTLSVLILTGLFKARVRVALRWCDLSALPSCGAEMWRREIEASFASHTQGLETAPPSSRADPCSMRECGCGEVCTEIPKAFS